MMKKLLLTLTILALSVLVLASCNNAQNGGGNNQNEVCTHENVVDVLEKRATCSTPGYTAGKMCSKCGAAVEGMQPTPVFDHVLIVSKKFEPTCEKEGYTENHKCAVCGVYVVPKETLEKKPHNWVDSLTVEATCSESGRSGGRHCADCFAVEDENAITYTAPTGEHTLYVSKDAVAPTCTTAGATAEQSCSVCNKVIVKSEEVAVDPDAHNGVVTKAAVDATCTTPGSTEEISCEHCEVVLTASEPTVINPDNHVFVEGVCGCGATEEVEEEEEAE